MSKLSADELELSGPWRVLVVDDDEAVRTLARRCLEDAGFSVT